jgi:hypothetical protein
MTCVNCGRIRSAVLQGKMAEAMGITIETLREKIGLSKPAPEDAEKFAKGGVFKTDSTGTIPVLSAEGGEAIIPKSRAKKAD